MDVAKVGNNPHALDFSLIPSEKPNVKGRILEKKK
jgi:hypothetical protein